MSSESLVEILGNFANKISFADLSPKVIEKAKISIIDAIACAFAGRDLPSSRIALKIWNDGKKNGKATNWLNGEKGDAESTAWINCLLMHSILHDDMQESTIGHMGSFVIPVTFAFSEQMGKNGKDMISAIVAAYEVSGRIASKSALSIVSRGFRASPIFGTFAAAVAAGKLIELTAEQMKNAIACAASFSCGLLEPVNIGSMEWRFQNGIALRNGVMSALLAKEGLLAAKSALEGNCGFFSAFGGPELNKEISKKINDLIKTLGKDFEIEKNIFKPYPTCGYNQVGVEIAIKMARENDLKIEDIESILVFVSPPNKNYPGGDYYGPFVTIDQALLSKPFSIAAALIFRDLTVDTYLSKLNSPELFNMAKKIKIQEKEDMGFLDYKIIIKLNNGKEIIGDQSLINPYNYNLNREMAEKKFCRISAHVLNKKKALKIVYNIFKLDEITNISEIFNL